MYFTRINSCDTSHYPKENLPVGWSFVSFSDVISLLSGRDLDVSQCNSEQKGTPYLVGASCIDNDHICFYRWTETPEVISLKDDILLSCKGTVGEVVLNTVGKIHIARQFMAIRSKWPELLIPDYIEIFIKSSVQYLKITAKGIIPGISRIDIMTLGIAIPPIAEQKRIARRVDAIFKMISEFENRQSSLKDSVEKSKARILDLAIHGKLVPQDASDEPAIEMLKRINPDFKPSHNLHYEGPIPVGWQLTKMGDLVDIISGTSYQKTDIVITGNGIRILRGGNIQNGGIFLCDDDVFINASLTNDSNTIHKGDIAIVASTGSSELIGKAAIATRDYPRTQIGAFLRIARPKSILISEYLGVIFQSDYYKSHIKKTAKGTNINNIKTSYLTDFIIPIPPREEQGRIMCKIRYLLAILNQITDSVNSSE